MPFVPLDADELRDVSTQKLRDYIWRFDAHIATIGDPDARLSAMLVLRWPLEELARREASRRRRSTLFGTLLPDFQHHVRWRLGGSTDVRETRLVQYLSEPFLTGLCA